MENIRLRYGTIADLQPLQQLYVETIVSVCKLHYNDEQIRVWTAGIENKKRWEDIFTQQKVLLAKHENTIVGFISLEKNYIDFLYVHKDYQRQGIAQFLYQEIENMAKKEGETLLHSEVSLTAKPFFEKMGFSVVKEQTIERDGICLINFKMKKEIPCK